MLKFRRLLAGISIISFAGSSHAIDVMPGEYVWAGDGTSLAMVYGQYQKSTHFELDGVGKIPESEMRATAGILRAVHYAEIGSWKTAFQVIAPMARFSKVEVGNAKQDANSGFGDLTFGATVYPLVSAEPTGTTLGLTAFLTAPTGSYKSDEINTGKGTWALMPQIGLVQGLGKGFFLETTVDVALYESKTHRGVKKTIDPATHMQAYVRYQASPARAFSLGYSKRVGGKTYADDIYVGLKEESDQVRLFASQWWSPTLQTQAMLGKDIDVEGGFRNDLQAVLRFVKVF